MHVTPEGKAPRRTKGQKLDYSPQGRTVCHQIADSIVKVGKGKYREFYDTKKADYMGRERTGESGCWTLTGQVHKDKGGKVLACFKSNGDGETSGHAHNAAMRYAIKELLKDMWIEWRKRVPEPIEDET